MLAICPDQIERFYAGNLPPSKGMTIHLQSFGSCDVSNAR